MAQKGKIFPIYQLWRLFTDDPGSLEGYPPLVAMFRTEAWDTALTPPPVSTWITCAALPWEVGDRDIGYRSEVVEVDGHDFTFGAMVQIYGIGRLKWRLSIRVDGVEQIPWGWFDYLDHVAWFPGEEDHFFQMPPIGSVCSPHGLTELRAKIWGEF